MRVTVLTIDTVAATPTRRALRRRLDGPARLTIAPGAPLRLGPSAVPAAIVAAKNIALTTHRRDGSPSTHPVWFSVLDDLIWVITSATAYKVRHLRRDPRALVAPCRRLGTPTGPAVAVTGRVLDRDEAPEAWTAVTSRYGWQHAAFLRSERRKGNGQVLLALAPVPGGGPDAGGRR